MTNCRLRASGPSRRATLFHLCVVPLGVLLCVLLQAFLAGFSVFAAVAAGGLVVVSALLLIRGWRRSGLQKALSDEQLLQSQKMAAIGEMSSGIAHEINTPLAVIKQETEWMEHVLRAPKEAEETRKEIETSIEQIAKQVERCREITHGMLSFARKMHTISQEIDLNQLVDDMLLWVEREVTPRGITVERRYSTSLPVVQTDGPLLRQVVLNLLNNAAHALQTVDCKGPGRLTIVTRTCEPHHVALEVRDNGPGISSENIEKIFNPFFTTKPPGVGTGLGLPLSLAIADKLGGTIQVSSNPGEETIFTVRLPVEKESS